MHRVFFGGGVAPVEVRVFPRRDQPVHFSASCQSVNSYNFFFPSICVKDILVRGCPVFTRSVNWICQCGCRFTMAVAAIEGSLGPTHATTRGLPALLLTVGTGITLSRMGSDSIPVMNSGISPGIVPGVSPGHVNGRIPRAHKMWLTGPALP